MAFCDRISGVTELLLDLLLFVVCLASSIYVSIELEQSRTMLWRGRDDIYFTISTYYDTVNNVVSAACLRWQKSALLHEANFTCALCSAVEMTLSHVATLLVVSLLSRSRCRFLAALARTPRPSCARRWRCCTSRHSLCSGF